MILFKNNFDSIYHREPKPLGAAIQQFIGDSTGTDPGSRVVEDLRAELDATGKVLAAVCTVLPDAEQRVIAEMLGLKVAE